jgi:hypothetical protein
MLASDPKAYDSLIDLLADLLVEDMVTEASADSKHAKGAKPGTARPSHFQQHHHRNGVEDTTRT